MTDDARDAPPTRLRAAARQVGAALSSFVLVTVVLVALAMIVVPLALGATPFTVLTGSMEPTMPAGTLVVTRPVDPADIELGDVVTYQLRSGQPEVVTHRVVGLGFGTDGARQLILRGDANNVEDDPVRAVQVRGVVVYRIPYLGYLNTYVGANRPGWLLRVVAAGLIAYGGVLVVGGARERRTRRAASPPGAPSQVMSAGVAS
jgi:signal peptidase